MLRILAGVCALALLALPVVAQVRHRTHRSTSAYVTSNAVSAEEAAAAMNATEAEMAAEMNAAAEAAANAVEAATNAAEEAENAAAINVEDANYATDSAYDGNVDMSMDTNMTMEANMTMDDAPPPHRRRARRQHR
jgi:cytoskeletal protein RodZ